MEEYWFEWLSKTALDPSLVYDYAMTLSHNELSEEDIKHFDHDFLLSMGISVAKHRLEILKLAKKNQQQQHNLSMRLVKAVEKTKRRIAKAFAHRSSEEEGEGSIVVVPKASYGWREGVLKRYKKPILLKKGRLMITDGGGIRIVGGGSSPSSVVAEAETATEEIRWDCMFRDMKPT